MEFFTGRQIMSSTILILVSITVIVNSYSHHIRHHRDRFKRQQGAHLYLPGSYVTDSEDPDVGPWEEWSGPSPCSRTCGGGVSTQYRQCTPGYTCQGPTKRHFSCNTQDCEDQTDFRAQQCSEFDEIPFEGVKYEWIPYLKAPNKCELNCMPKRERFYYRHKLHVKDGTRCTEGKLDVCIEGKCYPVGCDMMLGSSAQEDKCRVCGGDGSNCQTISGRIDDDVPLGYNDIFQIPPGATNIVIREIAPSNNYLAIRNKDYVNYLNGQWRIDFSRTLRFAGCDFTYSRYPQGFSAPDTITCLGPTDELLVVRLLAQEKNVGVEYEYSLPSNVVTSSVNQTYAWTFDQFTPCTSSCGGGIQYRNVSCAGRRTLEPVNPALCDPATRPAESQRCGEQPCDARWVTRPWGNCSAPCGVGGTQRRPVVCEQVIANGVATTVDDGYCAAVPKPEDERPCNQGEICAEWHIGRWKPCDHLCGEGKQTRKVTCFRKEKGKIIRLEDSHCPDEKPEIEKTCNLRPCEGVDWVTSDWSGCDKCGLVSETRRVQCATAKGQVHPDELCDSADKPESERKCKTEPKGCDFEWYASQWSQCSAKCGKGVKTRKVFCVSIDEFEKVEDDKCDESKKYTDSEECEAEQATCPGEWFSGPWSKCSKECGGGEVTRRIICMKDNETVALSDCGPETIPSGSEACNTQACDEDEVLPVDVTKPVDVSSETTPSKEYSETIEIVSTTVAMETTEEDEEVEYEIVDSDECDDGEWIEEDADEDDMDKSTPMIASSDFIEDSTKSSDESTESSLALDDLMLSDSTGTDEDVESTSVISPETGSGEEEESTTVSEPFTDEGSGDTELTSDGSTESSSDVTETADVSGSTEASEGTEETSASTDVSGSTDATESTEESSTDVSGSTEATESSGSTDATESSGSTDATESSGSTDATESSGSTDASESTDASASTDDSSTDASASTDDQTTDSSGSTDSSDKSTDATESTVSGATDSSSDSSDATTDATPTSVSSDSSTDATESSVSSSDVTETTDSTESTETTESTESTETTETTESTQSSDVTETTQSSDSTESTQSSDMTATTESSDMTQSSDSSASTDVSGSTDATESTVEGATTEFDIMGEGEILVRTKATTSDGSTDGSTDVTEESSDGSTDVTTDASSDGSTETTDDGTTETGDSTTDSGTTETSDGTTETDSGTTETDDGSTTSSDMDSTESTSESSTDVTGSSVTEQTESTEMTESTVTEVTESTVTEETESTESTVTEVIESTVTEETESTVTEETESTVTEVTESTEFDIWSSTTAETSTEYGKSDITEIFRPKVRKCKRRKQKTCKDSEFGCCYDQITAAEGPFGKGCPTPKTCNESKFGCCEDGVSPALGKNFKGCPSSHCEETLFGCCDDKKTPAEGENMEGCPPPPPACLKSKFGCCPDNVTEAKKKDDKCEPEEKKESEEDCTNTTFGCCPDGKTPAAGEDSKGCDAGKCTETSYGCCPDGITPAKGPNFKGCELPCGDTMFGCCEDGSTPAHGYNREGCCLSTEFGCCPDNIKPAEGPNNEGCGCEYSPYRCCPDKITPARGYNNEGCGCQYSEHGCCPDNQTPAKGPEFEGCLCHTFQFGCCPDGVTIVKGPHQQGCSCRESEFGCCGDEETPAKGPDGQGCSCAESKYGCCLDGQTEAKGDNFEGCEEAPIDLQAGCSEPKERGPCRNFTVKWYFDMEYAGCSRFWYGGCEGNNNRYKSQEECKEVCMEPQGKDRCKLPKISGPCEGYYPKWYYDKDKNHCAQFIYGGCLGNNNKFETVEECTKECVVDSRTDVCELPMEQGPCRGQYLRWYYDKESSRCQQYYYGGCQSNGNSFTTEMACNEKCSPANRKKEVCEMPQSQGNCTGREAKWYHDAEKSACLPFYYSGCEGNSNNFYSVEECEANCPVEGKKDICQLPAETGKCSNYVQKWYYDTMEKVCRQFYYGGCEGNGNNFNSEAECLQRCEAKTTTPVQPTPPQPEQPPAQPEQYRPAPSTEFRTDYCFYPSDAGPCRNTSVARWFYDRDGVCKQFVYGGCDGNENNFMTEEECTRNCGNAQDHCTLPQVVGPCTSFSEQFYYDYNTDRCEAFMYGGCAGNANRFASMVECQSRCKSQVYTEAPAPVAPQPEQYDDVVICFYDADRGNCDGDEEQFFYDAHKQECSTFRYTGCGGNENRFISIEACERKCGRYRGQEVCRFPQDSGSCRSSISKFYFNTESGRCEEFVYGGCEGNGNRFSTVEECRSMCEKEEPQHRPNITNAEICQSPVDVGICDGEQGSHKRWYFDNDRGECIAFIYSGCGGNYNQFTSSQACIETCSQFMGYPVQPEEEPEQPATNEVTGPAQVEEHPCEIYRKECQEMRCQYGVRAYVDESLCHRCACYDPCEGHYCDYDHKCAVEVNYNITSDQDDAFIAVCRKDEKPGVCPVVSSDHTDCPRECNSDVDCAFDLKCCSVGCGMSCLAPQMPAEMVTTTYQPAYTEAPVYNEYYPPHLDHEEYEPEVTSREGEVASLKCAIRGNPNPKFSWRKDNLLIDGLRARYRILLDGTLQVITVHKSDSGIYLCVADNGIGKPLQNEVRLNVTDGLNSPAKVLDIPEEESSVVVSLGSPATLNCYAYGFPFPTVTWWRNDQMVPLKTSQYEQRKDYSLHINRVELSNLGVYTCQAYNGVGKATSWLVTVHAPGPVESSDPRDKEFLKYVIDYNARPEVPQRPQVPQRPAYRVSPSTPYPRPSPSPQYYTRPPDRYSPARPGRPYTVPVKANILMPETTFTTGSDISIPCDVEGYPIPQVQWYKDGAPLQRSDKISISESNRIYIRKTDASDSGMYKCEAYNQYSRSESTVEVTVNGVHIPASCVDNPFFANCALIVKAKFCKHDYYARFCCKSCTEAGQLQPDYDSNLV